MPLLQIVLIVIALAILLAALYSGLRTYRAKREAEAQLAYLAGRLLEVQELERSRIALELHEGISHGLAVVAFNLDSLEGRLTSAGERAELLLLARRVRGLSDELQQITHGLHPARLQRLGLVSSVRALAQEMEHGQMRIKVDEFEWPQIIPTEIALSFYRVAQEAIHNAIKHSGAKSVLVSLRRDHGDLRLIVSDRGVGFTPQSSKASTGLGLTGMRQRLRNIGGSLHITSAPGKGTSISASLSQQREHRSSIPHSTSLAT
jgi:signal transduction histidine kinase